MYDRLITAMQRFVPDFLRRRLTYADFLNACRRASIRVAVQPYLFDEYLSRWGRSRIILNAGLAEPYRTFVGFHALGHWVAHPGPREFYLGSPGWLDKTELEASTLGYLAIAPVPGPPYPILEQAHVEGELMHFWVQYPERQPGRRITWTRRHTVLRRHLDQLAFE